MNEIRCQASFIIDYSARIPKEDQVHLAKIKLSESITHHIVDNPKFFTEYVTNYGTEYRAECYVLTPEDFRELRKQIEYDLIRGMPSILGGVSVG